MKKLALLVTLAAAVAGSVAIGNALATDPTNPLDFQQGFNCTLLDANGDLVFTTQSTFYWYQSGKATEHCIGEGAGNGTVVTWTEAQFPGLKCNFGFDGIPLTDNWNDRVSKSGESQLWCYGFQAPSAPTGPSGTAGLG